MIRRIGFFSGGLAVRTRKVFNVGTVSRRARDRSGIGFSVAVMIDGNRGRKILVFRIAAALKFIIPFPGF